MDVLELIKALVRRHGGDVEIEALTHETFGQLGFQQKAELLKKLIRITRTQYDASYELSSCDRVRSIVNQIAAARGLSGEEREKLDLVASFYKTEMCYAPTGVMRTDGTFNRSELVESRSSMATIIDTILGKDYGDIIRRSGKLGTILKVADDFNGMTSLDNPAKMCSTHPKVIFDGVHYYPVTSKTGIMGSVEYSYSDSTGAEKLLNVGPRDKVKSELEALGELKKFYDDKTLVETLATVRGIDMKSLSM